MKDIGGTRNRSDSQNAAGEFIQEMTCLAVNWHKGIAITGHNYSEPLRVWALNSLIKLQAEMIGHPPRVESAHGGGVRSVSLDGKGEIFISAGNEGTFRVHNVRTGKSKLLGGPLSRLLHAVKWRAIDGLVFKSPVVAISSDGTRAVSASANFDAPKGTAAGAIIVWDLNRGLPVSTISFAQDEAVPWWGMALTSDGKFAVGQRRDGLTILDLDSRVEVRSLSVPGIRSFALNPVSGTVLCGTLDSITVWNTQTGTLIKSLRHRADCVALSGDGRFAAVAGGPVGSEDIVYVFDLASETVRGYFRTRSPSTTGESVRALSMSPDGKSVLAMVSGRLELWSLVLD